MSARYVVRRRVNAATVGYLSPCVGRGKPGWFWSFFRHNAARMGRHVAHCLARTTPGAVAVRLVPRKAKP